MEAHHYTYYDGHGGTYVPDPEYAIENWYCVSAKQAEAWYVASLQAQKEALQFAFDVTGKRDMDIGDRLAEIIELMETGHQPNNIQGKES
jgi:hypothetical protein